MGWISVYYDVLLSDIVSLSAQNYKYASIWSIASFSTGVWYAHYSILIYLECMIHNTNDFGI